MNFPIFFSSFGIVFLCINYATEVKSAKALIYDYAAGLDGLPGKLVEFQNPADLQSCKTCIMACPASSIPEKEFDKRDSLTENSIFFRKPDSDLKTDTCDGQFKPGLIWNKKKKIYITGYELYYDEGQVDLQCDEYENFRKVPVAEIFDSNQNTRDTIMRQYYKEQHSSSDRVNRYKWGENTIFEIIDGSSNPQKWVFFFIHVLVIRGNGFTRQITLANRDVINDGKPDQTMTECKDFNIGDSGQASETEVKRESTPQDEDTEMLTPLLSKLCINNTNPVDCLEKVQILPMLFFHTFASKLATCTHLNIALIPKIIAEKQLKKVDQYLYTIRRIWHSFTAITFGISRILPQVRDDPELFLVYLPGTATDLRDLPTARVVFRHIVYVANYRFYQALIVIHTDLTITPNDSSRICSKQSELQGWDRITNEDSETGFTYVCPLTKNIVQRLELPKRSTGHDFELNKFPIRTGKIDEEMPTEDVTKEIDDKLEYFIDEGVLERI